VVALEGRVHAAEAATAALRRTVQEQAALLVLLSTRLRLLEAPSAHTHTVAVAELGAYHGSGERIPAAAATEQGKEANDLQGKEANDLQGKEANDLQAFMARVSGRCDETRALLHGA
jgi:hypothetical protein